MGKFKVKTRDNLFDKLFGGAGRLVKKRPEIINLNDTDIEKKSIMIGNHNGASGPFTYRTFMKHRFMTWGAHAMCEGFRSRWKYLYHTFYRQKLGYGKIKAFFIATVFGTISRLVYSYAGIIPVYFDMRIKNTFKYSFDCIEKDISVFVFPENSSQGYKELIDEFHSGFLTLSKMYYKKYQIDLPIYTLSFSTKLKKIIIGKPMYYQEMLKINTEEEILEIFRNYMNFLYNEHIIKQNKKDDKLITEPENNSLSEQIIENKN